MVAVFPNVCLWRRSYSQNWEVLTLKNIASSHLHMPVRPTLLHRMALVSFFLFRKSLGNLREFFGQMVYTVPPGKKLPVRLWWLLILLQWTKLAGSINKWQTQYQMVLCIYECLKLELCCGTIYIQTPIFLMHAASLHYFLTHITNVWGCMEILPTHCGAGSVKVNYYRCMRKIWGLVKPHIVK